MGLIEPISKDAAARKSGPRLVLGHPRATPCRARLVVSFLKSRVDVENRGH